MPHLTDAAATTLLAYLNRQRINVHPAFERAALQLSLNALMEWDASARIQAGHYERAQQRRAYRNGYRARSWQSPVGDLTLHIPKLRQGTYYPDWLRAAETHLLALLPRLFIGSPPAAEMQTLTDTLGIAPLPDDEFAHFVQALDALRERQQRVMLEGSYSAFWLDVIPVRGERWLRLGLARRSSDNAPELLAYEPRRDDDDTSFLTAMQRRLLLPPASFTAPSTAPRMSWGGYFADAQLVGEGSADNDTLLRYLTQMQTLQQNEIVVALGDALLPTHEADERIRRILMVA